MQEKGRTVEYDTPFDEFHGWLQTEERTKALDAGNIKLTFNSVSTRQSLPM